MKRTALLLLAAALLPLQVVAQGTVSGVVRDSRSGSAIELVNVGVPGMTSGTVTDSRGRYFLPVHGADSVTVRYTFTGYRPQQVRVATRRDTVVDILLVPSSQILDEVEIVDEKTRRSTFTNISIEKIEAAVGPSSGVESLLKTLPDVNSSNELSSQYSVRGGSFDENLVYINGVEVFRPMLIRNGQQEGMSIVNPDLVDHILFSPGGFDATYGDKMSSVLDITYRPHADSLSGKLSASLLGAAADKVRRGEHRGAARLDGQRTAERLCRKARQRGGGGFIDRVHTLMVAAFRKKVNRKRLDGAGRGHTFSEVNRMKRQLHRHSWFRQNEN